MKFTKIWECTPTVLRIVGIEGTKMQKSTFSKKYLFIVLLIIVLISPAISFADADRIFKENNKAVVVVLTYNEKGEPISQGSGFIVRADGAVVTNYHVISNAMDIKVKAGDKVYEVEGLIHTDKENDIVILKAKGKKLPIVKLGDIEKANIGEKVYVISSPQGLENTISDGILSGIREITPERKVLQITAPISPGSSGGPVFNKNGEVIGIATFLLKEAQNLNFAMPVNLIKDKIGSKKITALKDSTIEDYKKTAGYWFNLGFAYIESGMYKEAIEAFKKAIKLQPDFARAHLGLGSAYQSSGMYREAIEAYQEAIRLEPNLFISHFSLGLSYASLGMYKEAIASYKQVIMLKPDFVSAHLMIGVTYGKLGMYKEEIETLKQTIRIKPDNTAAHYGLGLAYLSTGNRGMSLEQYKILKKLDIEQAEKLFNLIYK